MKLLVSFGGIAGSPGLPPQEFKNVLSDVECDIHFITDKNRAWYYQGINDKVDNHFRLLVHLEQLIRGYDDITFFGNSMGGFAAILFGSYLRVRKVIAFSPQTFLGKEMRQLHKDTRWTEHISRLQAEFSEDQLNLLELMDYIPSNTKYDIHYLIHHRLSAVHAHRLIDFPGVSLYPYEGAGNLVQTLRDQNLLKDIIIGGKNDE